MTAFLIMLAMTAGIVNLVSNAVARPIDDDLQNPPTHSM